MNQPFHYRFDSRALRDAGLKKLAAMLKRPELLENAA